MQGVPVILVCLPADVILVQEDRVIVIFFIFSHHLERIVVEIEPREDEEGNKKKHAF